MHLGRQESSTLQQRETGARGVVSQAAGTAAPLVGPPQQPEPMPSDRCSSEAPTHNHGATDVPQQVEAGHGAAAQAGGAQLRPSSAPPHVPSDREAGGQDPAHLLEMLADEACRASGMAIGV